MHLAQIEIQNFRIFGSQKENKNLDLEVNKGLNLIVGENDSGKTAIVDAIRLVLGTTSDEWPRLTKDDFHLPSNDEKDRAKSFLIKLKFEGFSDQDGFPFVEWLNAKGEGDDTRFVLVLQMQAERKDDDEVTSRWQRQFSYSIKAGVDDTGKRIDGDARELLRVTYLKPLRDAVQELAAKRFSRLSQILFSKKEIKGENEKRWDPDDPKSKPNTLVDIMRKATTDLTKRPVLEDAVKQINDNYLKNFTLGNEPLKGDINIPTFELRQILERMELIISEGEHSPANTPRGLGINNLLFMATELLLIGSDRGPALPLVLIEEPEAHLHPQRQLRLVQFLEEQSKDEENPLQVIMTSHSPNIASKVPLKNLIVTRRGKAYPMGTKHTKLEESDYEFLERFLDVTKANLFFARGVILVEGWAEQILVPTIAELLGMDLTKHGVSIVNVGGTHFLRYAKIFQRVVGAEFNCPVAIITDKDEPPEEIKKLITSKTWGASNNHVYINEESVKTFTSPIMTLEYDLAENGLDKCLFLAIKYAQDGQQDKNNYFCKRYCRMLLKAEEFSETNSLDLKKSIAAHIYKEFITQKSKTSKAEVAQHLASILKENCLSEDELRKLLPSYLVKAIEHATSTSESTDETPETEEHTE